MIYTLTGSNDAFFHAISIELYYNNVYKISTTLFKFKYVIPKISNKQGQVYQKSFDFMNKFININHGDLIHQYKDIIVVDNMADKALIDMPLDIAHYINVTCIKAKRFNLKKYGIVRYESYDAIFKGLLLSERDNYMSKLIMWNMNKHKTIINR